MTAICHKSPKSKTNSQASPSLYLIRIGSEGKNSARAYFLAESPLKIGLWVGEYFYYTLNNYIFIEKRLPYILNIGFCREKALIFTGFNPERTADFIRMPLKCCKSPLALYYISYNRGGYLK